MKALTELDNIEKAELLHSLFPKEVSPLLDFVLNLSIVMKEDGKIQYWNSGLLSADLSESILMSTIEAIEKSKTRLVKRRRDFADNLFDGFYSMLTKYCIEQYITVREHTNAKFVQCCKLLFF